MFVGGNACISSISQGGLTIDSCSGREGIIVSS